MKESDNYPHAKIGDAYYYIPNPIKALEFGFFKLEDTGEVFKVTGVNMIVINDTVKEHCEKCIFITG